MLMTVCCKQDKRWHLWRWRLNVVELGPGVCCSESIENHCDGRSATGGIKG